VGRPRILDGLTNQQRTYRKHRAKRLANARKWSLANPERKKANARRYAQRVYTTPEWKRAHGDRMRLLRYGLTRERYDALVLESCGRCGICGEQDSGTKHKALHVDHCHETKIVRGLVCGLCNTALGVLEDRKWVLKAEEYLATERGV
jgi:hypothetical protein